MKKYNCVVCDNVINEIDYGIDAKDENRMWNEGVVEKITAGFGSKFDLDSFLIAICDECIEKKKLIK
jgi:uncharacterized membrane protein